MASVSTPVAQGDTPAGDLPKITGYVIELLKDGEHCRFSEGVYNRHGADDYAAKFNVIGAGTSSEARVWRADVIIVEPAAKGRVA